MNPNQVFQKTDAGRDEIVKRARGLDARRRMALILVDGHSSAESIAGKLAHAGDGMAMLQSLWTEGYIEAVDGSSAKAQAAPARAAGAAAAPDADLHQLKRLASSQIEKLMGPDGDAFSLKIEKAETVEEFYVEARKVRDALSAFLGPRKAEIFAQSLGL